MSVVQYEDKGPTEIKAHPDIGALAGKSVVVTGGASGLGKAYAKAFAEAGAFVTIGDYDENAGRETEAELKGKVKFIKCDVRNWEDQVALFEAAVQESPEKSCDIVIANAGVVGADDLSTFQEPTGPPVKPNLRIIEVNLLGMAYTAKLAMHYFRRQPLGENRDRCLILKGSIAAYADQPGSPQYNISKWGARGLMRNLRRTSWRESIRVNLVAPWYVRTPILSKPILEFLEGKGVKFAAIDDCCNAMLNIASDATLNGRAFGVMPREVARYGYIDLDHDDYKGQDPMKDWQEIVLDTAEVIVELAGKH